jgi:hypothetical protein
MATDNEFRIVQTLEDGPATYTELQERSGVPQGSFDRTLRALIDKEIAVKSDGSYHLTTDGSDGPGVGTGPQDARSRLLARKRRVADANQTYAWSAAHGGMRPYSEIRAAKGYTQTDTD